ncbi:MAG: putative phage protein [Candidatus Nomurabacteria bacterium GW2011_GWB1_37_5]|uniref:Putative phage protein n=1 Tax=Candidatus Nomurabacteria bacterium GW2011_GWB1_37_5 TaxID=1618742 RepID=A0A0G0H9S5_9BACT|nr:MAG: putative phage protein [Candidatus Nomurabacteria bacterium GW2011_GWB1_37_5]
MKIIDHNEEKAFHPSLDTKDNILVLGFRRKTEDGKESDLFIIKADGQLFISEKAEFEYNEKKFLIDKKKRLLAKLSQKWGADRLTAFLESLSNPINKISERAVYEKIKDNLKRYIELEHEADYSILTTWVIGTYFFPSFGAYPYIHIKAPKGSGKSQCLQFILQTAFNAVKARASLPALRDTVDALRGTYLMDQADALYRNNMEDFLDVLTDSYKRGSGTIRKMVANKNNWSLEEFEAYSPKGFASINQLPEDLRDRCIVIPLIRSSKNYPSINEEDEIWKEIKNDLYILLINQFQYVGQTYFLKEIEYKRSNEIFGRRLELWLPIEAIMRGAIFSPEEEIEVCKKRFLSRYEFASYQTSEIEVAVIETIIALMKDKQELILRPKEIASQIDTELFDDDDKFQYASQKQKSTIVGRAITKFNLAVQKLARDSQGERYLFKKDQLEKIHRGYFPQKEENDTQTYTEEKPPENKDLFNESSSVF